MRALGKNRPGPCILHGLGFLTLAACLGAWAAVWVLRACDGELIPPLDDSYIYLQYARGAAHGEPFAYQTGAPPTRGATSLLYPLLLAPWVPLLPPDRLPWAAFGLGVLCLAGSALFTCIWAARRIDARAGPVAGLLVLLSGHFVWGALSGMDIGIYSLTLTGSLAAAAWAHDASTRASGIRRGAALGGALFLLGLARPEGILLAFLIALGVTLSGSPIHSARGRSVLILAPLLALALTVGVNLLAVGEPGGNSLAVKAIWGEPRSDVRAEMVRHLPRIFLDITGALVSDFRSVSFGTGTGVLLAAIWIAGVAAALLAACRREAASVRWLFVVFLGALLVGLTPVGYRSHHNRYQIPYVPISVLLAVEGAWFALGRRGFRWFLVPTALLGLLLVPGLVRYQNTMRLNASNIHDQQVATGRWIDRNLPPHAVVALNDAGAIAYYGGRRVVDLVGLVTNGSAAPNRAGSGSLYEWLEGLPPAERPTHFAIFPSWYPYLTKTSLIDRKLAQFTLGRNTISGGDLKAIYVANWSHVGDSEELWIRRSLLDLWGFRVVDAVDVADLESEAEHDYTAFDTWRDTLREFPVDGMPDRSLIDGGRQPSLGERFRMRCRPGQPGALVLRTEAFRRFVLEVRVDGRKIGLWDVPRRDLAWTEPLFELPGDAFTRDTATIELIQAVPEEGPYPSFHYWLLQ
jgi:hypothetical protein